MNQITTVLELRESIAVWRKAGQRIAFVPTMGNLHQGHLALVKQAKQLAERVVVSIFINPLQFGEGDDFDRYPRTFERDAELLQGEGVDLVFLPSVLEMYPQSTKTATRVEVPFLSDILCGAHRPGHFVGVTTVVAKLFNMVQPDVAVFGKKDYQQLFLIKRMVADLAMPINIVGVETLREASGLAMSSRNGYLSADEKQQAALIYQILQELAEKLSPEADFVSLSQYAVKKLQENRFTPDYVEIRQSVDLSKASEYSPGLVILIAARIGGARLIDNLEIH